MSLGCASWEPYWGSPLLTDRTQHVERASWGLTFIHVLTLESLSLGSCIPGDSVSGHQVDDGSASQWPLNI